MFWKSAQPYNRPWWNYFCFIDDIVPASSADVYTSAYFALQNACWGMPQAPLICIFNAGCASRRNAFYPMVRSGSLRTCIRCDSASAREAYFICSGTGAFWSKRPIPAYISQAPSAPAVQPPGALPGKCPCPERRQHITFREVYLIFYLGLFCNSPFYISKPSNPKKSWHVISFYVLNVKTVDVLKFFRYTMSKE